MKIYVLLYVSLFPIITIGQNDTAIIKHVIDYINTDEFRKVFKDTFATELEREITTNKIRKNIHKYREQEWEDVSLWFNEGNCFAPRTHYYRITLNDKQFAEKDRALFTELDTVSLKLNYIFPESKKCMNTFFLTPTILRNDLIEFEYLSGYEFSTIRLGIGHTLRFKVIGETISLISIERIIYN